MEKQQPAPKFLNLFRIKLPVGSVTSIAHRISGVVLFLMIPLAVWLFGLSLEGAQGFQQARGHMSSPSMIPAWLLLVWSLSHHLLAGIRHLLMDMDLGMRKAQSRASAWTVNIGAALITLLYLVSLI
jgi:succinate dehydrogenase / fumarate reductase, cytochrome b subunit